LGKQKLEEKKRMFEEKRREERLKPKYVDEIAAAGALIQYLQVDFSFLFSYLSILSIFDLISYSFFFLQKKGSPKCQISFFNYFKLH